MSGFIKINKSLTKETNPSKITTFGYISSLGNYENNPGLIALMTSMQGAYTNFSFTLNENGDVIYDNRSGVKLELINGELNLSNTDKFTLNNQGDLIRN